MVKEVLKKDAKRFIEKAEEFYVSALENYQKGRFNVSVFDSSQAIIMANDGFCVFALGRRASKDHREAIRLHVEASSGRGSKKDIVAEALEKRSKFGYTQVESSQMDAQLILVRARRFIEWVKGKIG
jgi:HEPN domain-containing protein